MMIPDELLDIDALQNRLPKVGGKSIVSVRQLENYIKDDLKTKAHGLQPEYRQGRKRLWSLSAVERFKNAIVVPISTSRPAENIITLEDRSKRKQEKSASLAVLGYDATNR